jgi:membrane protease YdiL (CAAX protease family)
MIEKKLLYRFILYIFISSFFFGVLSYFKLQFQFYLWEFFVDLKIVTLVAVVALFYKRKEIVFGSNELLLIHFDWKQNTTIFFAPVLVYILTIVLGLFSNQMTINKLDNAVTLVLATMFDIPALYVFSATTVLIEEILFRGVLLSSFQRSNSIILTALFSSIVWSLFIGSEIFSVEELNLLKVSMLLLFFFSLGLFLSMLFNRFHSIWPGYSFRIGIITLTPITLTSQLVESDSFFSSSSVIFISEGIMVSMLLIGASIPFLMKKRALTENSSFRNIS